MAARRENGDGEEPLAAQRARLRARRRERKSSPQRMPVTGRGVFVIQRLIQERAQEARNQLRKDGKRRAPS